MSLNHKMGEKHEEDLVERLGGRKTKASGSQWTDQMDGRHSRYHERFAFAWDGKSTLGNSIGVSRKMVEKAIEQAGHERPMIALRWYDTERLKVAHDWVAVRLDDHEEMVDAITEGERLKAFVAQAAEGLWNDVLDFDVEDIKKLVEASRRTCASMEVFKDEDEYGMMRATCSCGWWTYRVGSRLPEMMNAHLDV